MLRDLRDPSAYMAKPNDAECPTLKLTSSESVLTVFTERSICARFVQITDLCENAGNLKFGDSIRAVIFQVINRNTAAFGVFPAYVAPVCAEYEYAAQPRKAIHSIRVYFCSKLHDN